MERRTKLLLLLFLLLGVWVGSYPLLRYTTSWIGNTFEGAGPNGEGQWVQNMIDEIEVTPEGVVITASTWDEAGRCTGLYKDGKVNARGLRQLAHPEKAWGWGTASSAVAAWREWILIANLAGELLRFRWNPPDINSVPYVDQITYLEEEKAKDNPAIAMSAREDVLVLLLKSGDVQLRRLGDLALINAFRLPGATDVVIDPQKTLWFIVGRKVLHYSLQGEKLEGEISDVGRPSALAIDNQEGLLMVCDDGPDQQVLFYDIRKGAKLVRRFGERGGLRAGTPGLVAPQKLYGLRGAGTDRQGNLYVALCIGPQQGAGTTIRSFDPEGKLRWQVESHAFLDCYSIDPQSDGREVYGVDEIFTLDLGKPVGKEWRLKAITLDPIRYPQDPRLGDRGAGFCTAILRHLQGRRVLFTIGQYAGGVNIFLFEPPPSQIAYFVKRIGKEGWAWDVDERGDIWWGDAPQRKIYRYRFLGFASNGTPLYSEDNPDVFPWPEGFEEIGRIRYVPETATLYISGYTKDKPAKSWGLMGSVLARYDGWVGGKAKKRWEINLPTDDEGLHPKSFDVVGDYVFTVQCKPTQGKPAMVSVFRADTGKLVGVMVPGKEVGGNSGWVDITHGIRAFKRKNGEYLVLVEEDWRGKNLLYRWRP